MQEKRANLNLSPSWHFLSTKSQLQSWKPGKKLTGWYDIRPFLCSFLQITWRFAIYFRGIRWKKCSIVACFEPYQLTIATSACAKLYMNKFLELNNTPTSKQKIPVILSQLQVETVCSSTFIIQPCWECELLKKNTVMLSCWRAPVVINKYSNYTTKGQF
jgi:hypothetical protein